MSIFIAANITNLVNRFSRYYRNQHVYLYCIFFFTVFVKYFQHSAIYPHAEHLTCYPVIVCYDSLFNLKRVVERFHGKLCERIRAQIRQLLGLESRLVLVRHVNYRQHMSEKTDFYYLSYL